MSESILIQAGGTLHRISRELAEVIAFNLRAHDDEYLTDEERIALADKFEETLVESPDKPMGFSEVEALCLMTHVDHLGVHDDSPDLRALFWALRGTDPPKEQTR